MLEQLAEHDATLVNNSYYNDLADRWYMAKDDPVALLRAEGKMRNIWVNAQITLPKSKILDVGCGGGLLSNYLAQFGHQVTGIDLSSSSLEIARKMDKTGLAHYQTADAYQLPFANESFDVVTAMDFLEHVSNPQQVINEAARVLKPGGTIFFHTFNRNWLAWLIVIKGVEWFVKNTPKDLHVLPLFIKPGELRSYLTTAGFENISMRGLRPRLNRAFFRLLWTKEVPTDFSFVWTKFLLMSYSGIAKKKV